jgi:2-dehydropantoate 2-reductase
MTKKKILVIGLGPVGGIFASHMANDGNLVYGVDIWEKHVAEIAKNGLRIEGKPKSKLVEACSHLDQLKEREFDYVIISVKTPNMARVIEQIKDLPGEFRVVSLQNGLDNEEYLADYFGKKRILRVAINYAGNITALGSAKISFFHKPNYVGCVCHDHNCDHAEEFARITTDAELDTKTTDDIKRFTWRKTILNAALSPPSALLGMLMDDLMTNEGTRNLAESLLKESIAVAKAVGYNYGDSFLKECMEYLSTAGPHKTSMLVDIESGNPTEIDFINGRVAFYAKRHNIPTPHNTSMTAMIKAKETVVYKEVEQKKRLLKN